MPVIIEYKKISSKLHIIGRAISGLGVGLGVPATAIYVAEVLYKNKQIDRECYESRFPAQS